MFRLTPIETGAELWAYITSDLESVFDHPEPRGRRRGRAAATSARAETGWRRMLAGSGGDDPVAASLVYLGRRQLGACRAGSRARTVLAERSLVLAECGHAREAEPVAAEAATLADDLSFDG